jgi:two-component system, NarL family, sensor histidine kinase UhpB
LRWYVQNFSKRAGIDAQFRVIGFEEKLPSQIETAFYRIVQEALNNISKHAEASQVEISLEQRDSTIHGSIIDNGKGFDLDKALHPESPERGFGMIGMQERISLLGGKIDIQSRPGFGTRIHIEVLHKKEGNDDIEKDTSSVD